MIKRISTGIKQSRRYFFSLILDRFIRKFGYLFHVVKVQKKYWVLPGDMVSNVTMTYGLYEEAEIRLLKHVSTLLGYNGPERVFIDCGAHLGTYCVEIGESKHVYAIEANPVLCHVVSANLAWNNISGKVLNIAASNQNGTIYFSPNMSGLLNTSQVNNEGIGIQIPCQTLDTATNYEEWDSKTTVTVKIDVEGHELSVLEGMQRIIKTWNPLIQIELFPHDDNFIETRLKKIIPNYTVIIADPYNPFKSKPSKLRQVIDMIIFPKSYQLWVLEDKSPYNRLHRIAYLVPTDKIDMLSLASCIDGNEKAKNRRNSNTKG